MSGYDSTLNYNLKKPWVDADFDAWGGHWNQNADAIDNLFQTMSNRAIVGPSPTSPGRGQLWWDSIGGQLYVEYDDGNSVQFVSANSVIGLPITGGQLTGPLLLYGNAAQPLEAVPLQQLTSTVAAAPFLPTAGGSLTGPLLLAGNATQPLHAVALQQLTSTVVAGIVADGATDNTIALQAAINTAQTSNTNPFTSTLLLPKGRILTGPLTISGQIVIEGVHDNSTVLVLKDGSAAACITISPTGTAPNPGDARRTLTLRNLRIENQTWYSGNAAAHGINLAASGAWPCRITLSQVTIYGMPGSGINAVAFLGWVELYDCSLFHNGLYGADCNSCFDWKWFGGDIALNGVAGARISGCGSFVWSGTNCYSNALYNLQLFLSVGSYSGNHRFTNCNFDRSNQVGVYYDVRDVMGVVFDGCTFTNCSTVTPNTYSDVLITGSANNLAVFTACVWGNNNANDASYQEKWALEFSGTTQTVVLDGNNTYWGGTLRTNALSQVRSAASSYGIVADGVTDNTAALQAAINAVQTSVYEGKTAVLRLPIGRMITGPLTIAGQITIEGSQSSGSVLVLKTGSTAACITIAPAGSAFPGGAPAGRIILKSVQIESQSIKTGPSTAHGIQTSASAPWSCHVTMSDVTIYGMPGDGLNGPPSFNGGVDCYDCSFYNNLGNGVSCNSCNDWHWYGGVIGVNGGAGVVLSGCSQFVFTGTNIFSNGTHNLYLYSGAGVATGTHWFTDCMFDRGNQIGVLYGMAGQGGTTFKGCTFAGCSVTSPGTYSDVVIASGTNDLAVFSGCNWGNNHAADSTWPEKWALEFQSATGDTVVLDGSNTYYGGALRTNQFAQVFLTNAGTRHALNGPAVIVAKQQYTGLIVTNGTNAIASIGGFAANNDYSVFALAGGGVTGAQLSASPAYAPNYLNGDLWLGNGSSSATPAGRSLRATDGSGTDVAGASLVIAPGRGTGAGGPGAISFRFAPPGTAGSTLNAESERFYMSYSGARVTVTQQYTGFSVGNLTNSIFTVSGFTATADLGVMTLYNGGTGVIQFSAGSGFAPTYINQPLYIGNGNTNATPSGQLIAATGGLGTNIAGANLQLMGGASTGTGIGGSIILYTTPAGSTGAGANTLTARVTLDGPGNVVVGPAALAITATSGFLYIPTCAGTPTGVPTAYAGRAPILFDTTGNKLWIYNGNWKGVVVA